MLEKSKNLAVFGLEEGRWRRRRCGWYKRPRRATAPWEVVETSGGGAVAIRIMDLDFSWFGVPITGGIRGKVGGGSMSDSGGRLWAVRPTPVGWQTITSGWGR